MYVPPVSSRASTSVNNSVRLQNQLILAGDYLATSFMHPSLPKNIELESWCRIWKNTKMCRYQISQYFCNQCGSGIDMGQSLCPPRWKKWFRSAYSEVMKAIISRLGVSVKCLPSMHKEHPRFHTQHPIKPALLTLVYNPSTWQVEAVGSRD